MHIRIGNKSINLAAIVAVYWDLKDEKTQETVVRADLQGVLPVHLYREEIEQFKTAFDQLLTLEQFVSQTQAQMQQQIETIAQAEQELKQRTQYVETLKREVEMAAAQMHFKKNQGLIRPKG